MPPGINANDLFHQGIGSSFAARHYFEGLFKNDLVSALKKNQIIYFVAAT
jgi:hypothetical protein